MVRDGYHVDGFYKRRLSGVMCEHRGVRCVIVMRQAMDPIKGNHQIGRIL